MAGSGGSKASWRDWAMRVVAIIVVLYVIVLIIAVISSGVRSLVRPFRLKPFAARLSEYTSIPGLKELSGEAYVIGKVITVNKGENRIDPMYLDLPSDLAASTPEEVGTVIWLEWKEYVVGTYTDGAKGYRITCQVTVIDKVKAAIVGRKTFRGSDPPKFKSGHAPGRGSRPYYAIIDYITTLPKR